MMNVTEATAKLARVEITGRHKHEGDSVQLSIRVHLALLLTPELVGGLPWVSKAVIELMRASGDDDDDAKATDSLKTKRTMGGAMYRLDSVEMHGTMAGAFEVRVVKGIATLRWKMDTTIELATLERLGALVGTLCECVIVVDQQDLTEVGNKEAA